MSTIDTHTIVEELITANVPKKQAEVFVKRFVIKEELDTVEKEHSGLATKADIIHLEHATIANIDRLDFKIENIANGLSSNIRDLTKDISWLKTITIANFTLLLVANFTLLLGGIIAMLFKP